MNRQNIPLLALALAALVGLVVLALHALPAPVATVEDHCVDSPMKTACRALVRAGGAPVPDLAGLRDIADPQAPDLATSPLVAGVAALADNWPIVALKNCSAAAATAGPDRVPALICASRAAALLGWPMRSIYYALRALDAAPFSTEQGAAWLLIGDAHRLQRDCRQARTAYLRALDVVPDLEEARKGLEACGATPPPRPDLTGEAGDEAGDLLARRGRPRDAPDGTRGHHGRAIVGDMGQAGHLVGHAIS